MSRPTELDRLLAEDAWARRLAHALARGAEDPDDLVQEAYARAFAQGALPVTHVRGWFARVMRNLTVERRRARGASGQRDAAHARARAYAAGDTETGPRDSEPTPDELAARAEVQERLAAAVLALPARQRDVILLRHFDGAEIADIARRLGLAPSTVQEHLARAHAELRRKLAAWGDDRWSHGLALLLTGRGSLPGGGAAVAAAPPSVVAAALAPYSPVLIAMTLSKVSLGVVITIALTVVLWRAIESPEMSEHDDARSIASDSSHTPPLSEAGAISAEQSDEKRVAIGSAVRKDATVVESKATVDVSVVDMRGAPIEGAAVNVELTPEERRANRVEVSGFEMWQTPPGMSGTTDHGGSTRLTVPAGRPLSISAIKRGRQLEDGVPSSAESIELESLLPGASTTVTFRLRQHPDVEVVLQIVDAVTGAPVVGAPLFMESQDGMTVLSTGERVAQLPLQRSADAVSDGAGFVRVTGQSWLDTWCLVMAPEYGPRMQPLWPAEGANAAIKGSLVVELERSSSIEVLAHGAPQGAELRARMAVTALRQRTRIPSADAYRFGASKYELRASADHEDRFLLSDVPPSAEVSLSLHAPATGALLYSAAQPIQTRAGEVHRVIFDFAASGRLVCTVSEVDGSPTAGQLVQLSSPSGRTIGKTPTSHRPLKSARTDAAGVAVFADVAPGTWVVGLAHAERGRGVTPPSLELDHAPYELEVEMPAGGGDVPVAFTMHRGLYIEGRVVAPGALPTHLVVMASMEAFHAMVQGSEVVDGRFRLGPLMPGTYTVGARSASRGDQSFAPSDDVEARAGATGVELALRLGVRIEVRAIDAADGNAVDAKFTVSRLNGGWYGNSYGARATFLTDGLEPGVYCALALAPDGRVGVVDRFTAESSTELTAVTVPIDVGGTLTVTGPDRDGIRDVYVMRDECVLDLHRLQQGERASSVLPPGRYRVGVVARQRGEGQPAWVDRFDTEQAVEIRAGEEAVLTLSQ
jgi:RNA polymerase sigma factor (sigma-70 family)